MMRLQSTTNYKQFKFLPENRQINPQYLVKLIESIKMKNHLDISPIKVNSKFEVFDGQHRLMAAKHLGLEIFYLVKDNLTLRDLALFNNHQKKWTIGDYANFYVNQKKDDYLKLLEFARKHDLSLTMAIAALSIDESHRPNAHLNVFRHGNFKIVNLEMSEEFANNVKRLNPYLDIPSIFRDREYWISLHRMIYILDVSIDELINRIRIYGKPIFRKTTTKDYLRQFEDICNSKTRFY